MGWRRRSAPGPRRAAAWIAPLGLALLVGCGEKAVPPAPDGAAGKSSASSSLPSPSVREALSGLRGAARVDPDSSQDAYVPWVLAWRRQREAFFGSDPDSPVPAAQRGSFGPLEYYPVDPSWRLELPLIRYPDPQVFTLVTNMGEKRTMSRAGRVEFVRAGVRLSLQLYRELDGSRGPGSFWVPFVDAGAGRETYPAGRYLDAELRGDGTVVLDFNLAYNPYCAYGWDYSCPMTPRENRLPIAVRAGERGFHH